ncbi:hypothetical protein BaRGS_00007721, partial [Batillaria attramentaria]
TSLVSGTADSVYRRIKPNVGKGGRVHACPHGARLFPGTKVLYCGILSPKLPFKANKPVFTTLLAVCGVAISCGHLGTGFTRANSTEPHSRE